MLNIFDADWTSDVTDQRSTRLQLGYECFLVIFLISWKTKQHDVVSRSGAKAKYQAMLLLCWLITDMGLTAPGLTPLHYDTTY